MVSIRNPFTYRKKPNLQTEYSPALVRSPVGANKGVLGQIHKIKMPKADKGEQEMQIGWLRNLRAQLWVQVISAS